MNMTDPIILEIERYGYPIAELPKENENDKCDCDSVADCVCCRDTYGVDD